MDKEHLERKLHIVHLLASFSPKDVKLIREGHAPIQHIRDSDLWAFLFQDTEIRLFHPSKKQTVWWSRRIWE